jgi:uncharacterized protein (TIGR03435 family)
MPARPCPESGSPCFPVFSQQGRPTGSSFELASVKPSAPDEIRTYGPRSGDRFVAINCTVKAVIAMVYNVREDKISGGPNWIGTDSWTIEAKAEVEPAASCVHLQGRHLCDQQQR